jgi:hypothetical protein
MAKNHNLVRTMRTVMSRKPAFWVLNIFYSQEPGSFALAAVRVRAGRPPRPCARAFRGRTQGRQLVTAWRSDEPDPNSRDV